MSYQEQMIDFENCISKKRKEKIQSFRFEDDKLRSLLAEILVYYGLTKDFFLLKKDIQIVSTSYGKPYLKNINNIYFNISHSGDYVICAISDHLVGIDIEKIGTKHEKLIKVLHKREIAYLNEIPYKFRRQVFYNLWSLKESYVKYLGFGLSFSLAKFYFKKEYNTLNVYREDKKYFKGKIEEISIDLAYSCSVCYDAACITSIERLNNKKLKRIIV